MKDKELLYKIRVLERTPNRLAQMYAQALKRKSDITFSDEDQTLPEAGKWMESEPLDLSSMDIGPWKEP